MPTNARALARMRSRECGLVRAPADERARVPAEGARVLTSSRARSDEFRARAAWFARAHDRASERADECAYTACTKIGSTRDEKNSTRGEKSCCPMVEMRFFDSNNKIISYLTILKQYPLVKDAAKKGHIDVWVPSSGHPSTQPQDVDKLHRVLHKHSINVSVKHNGKFQPYSPSMYRDLLRTSGMTNKQVEGIEDRKRRQRLKLKEVPSKKPAKKKRKTGMTQDQAAASQRVVLQRVAVQVWCYRTLVTIGRCH